MENEKRLIYMDDVLEEIEDAISNIAYTSPYQNDISTMVSGMERVRDIVEDATTVDAVEVVHGYWEYGKWEQGHWAKGNERCRCSVCHRDFAVDNLNIWHGCPQCLAKMDGGNEDGS